MKEYGGLDIYLHSFFRKIIFIYGVNDSKAFCKGKFVSLHAMKEYR